MLQRLIEFFASHGLGELLNGYFNAPPCLSLLKSVLHRIEPLQHPPEWHQDGAFMGDGIKSLNLWISLTDCGAGTSAPGMDLIPKRLDKVIDATGKNGAVFDWSVSQKTIDENYSDAPPAQPHFGVGDAIFFDHFNLHATSSGNQFTQTRYAIETWFFSSSNYAVNQTPALLYVYARTPSLLSP